MFVWVRLRMPDHREYTLVPGDLIGRTWSAALRIDDPSVSEAHALVSLRGEVLVMLPLRRRLYVDQKPVDTVILAVGQKIRLAPQITLEVVEVSLPTAVLGLEGDGLPAQVLAGTSSLVLQPQPALEPGLLDRAAAVFWPNEHRWRYRPAGGADADLEVGVTFLAGGRKFRAVSVLLREAGQAVTHADLSGPVRIVTHYDTVHIHRGNGAPLVLNGQMARVVSELVAVGNPMSWEELAAQQWPGVEREVRRKRWDVLLVRLRERLREGNVRPDLVQSTGNGLVELVRQDGDVVEDRS